MAEFTIGDYRYTTLTGNNVVAQVVNTTKTTYQNIPSQVTHNNVTYSVTSMDSCFDGCTSLTTSPEIPNSVTSMNYCFRGCTSLTIAPVIPNSVTSMNYCFLGCTNLEGDVYVYTKNTQCSRAFFDTIKPIIIHSMNDNAKACQLLARTTSDSNAYVNVHPEEEITFVDTEMKYKKNDKTTTLSLQTNANLVQCEVPNLVNGDYITTNVNDALIDLYKRGVLN